MAANNNAVHVNNANAAQPAALIIPQGDTPKRKIYNGRAKLDEFVNTTKQYPCEFVVHSKHIRDFFKPEGRCIVEFDAADEISGVNLFGNNHADYPGPTNPKFVWFMLAPTGKQPVPLVYESDAFKTNDSGYGCIRFKIPMAKFIACVRRTFELTDEQKLQTYMLGTRVYTGEYSHTVLITRENNLPQEFPLHLNVFEASDAKERASSDNSHVFYDNGVKLGFRRYCNRHVRNGKRFWPWDHPEVAVHSDCLFLSQTDNDFKMDFVFHSQCVNKRKNRDFDCSDVPNTIQSFVKSFFVACMTRGFSASKCAKLFGLFSTEKYRAMLTKELQNKINETNNNAIQAAKKIPKQPVRKDAKDEKKEEEEE